MSSPEFPRSVSRQFRAADKRRGDQAVPVNLRDVLSKEQLGSLKEMESFGWHLAFVRRAGDDSQAIVARNDNSGFGVLEKDGSINTMSHLEVRH